MKPLPPPDSADALPAWSATSVEWLIGALLVAGPLTLGALDAWGQVIVLSLIAIAGVVVLAGTWASPRATLVWSWAYVPIAVLVLAILASLVPLPFGLRHAIAPGATILRDEIAQLAGRPIAERAPLSLYPLATERQLRLILAGIVLFAVVLQVYSGQPARRLRLLRTITGVGLAMALLGLGQYCFDAQTILGLAASANPYSGPFTNHSHFGQFINLSLGAAVAVLLLGVGRMRASGLTWTGVREAFTHPSRWDLWMAATHLLVGPVAILVSLTRGGVLSLLTGAAVTVVLLARIERRRARADAAFFGFVIGGGVLLLALAFGFNAAYDRLASLRHIEASSGGRLEIVRDAIAVWRSAPWLGTGLGTHAFVFPAFDRSSVGSWASHAENEYAQLLEETGAIGLLATLAFIGIVWTALLRCVRQLRAAGTRAGTMPQIIAPGLALGLVAVMVHSATDFGQHVPAVAFVTAIISALVIGLARDSTPHAPESRHVRQLATRAIASVALLASIGFVTPGLARDRRAERAWWAASMDRAVLDARGWDIASPTYRALLIDATVAAREQPRDVEYAFWLNAWRWEAIAQQADGPAGGLDPQLASWTAQLVAELLATVDECPTFGRPLAFAGQLRAQLPGNAPNESGNDALAMIERGARLAPYDPQACFTAGRVAALRGDRDAANALLRRAIAMGYPRGPVVDLFATLLHDARSAQALAGDDLETWNRLIDVLMTQADSSELDEARRGRDALVTRLAADPNANANTLDRLAATYLQLDQPKRAIDCLIRATSADYGNVDRRLRLAGLLAQEGRYDEAVTQATIARRFRPNDATITQQLETWTAAARHERP